MKNKDEFRFNVRTTKQEKNALKNVSALTGVPQSVIVREAIADKVSDLRARVERGEKINVGVVSR